MVKAIQASLASGEISPTLLGRVDLVKYATGLAVAKNVYVHAEGGASNRAGTLIVGETRNSDYSVTFGFQFSNVQSYILEFTDQKMRVIKDGAYVLDAASATITGATAASPVVVTTSVAHGLTDGDEIYISDVVGMTELNGRNYRIANSTATTFELTDLFGVGIDGTAFAPYASGGSATPIYEIDTPYVEADLDRLDVVQDADIMYITHPLYAVRKLSRTGHNAWTLTTVAFSPGISAPTGVAAVATVGAGSVTYTYVATAVDEETGEESLASSEASCTNNLATAGNYNTISWSAVTGASRYLVYKKNNGAFGYIGYTEALSFDDNNITADVSDTPRKARNPFASAGDYPSTATFFEQRLYLASSVNDPQVFDASTSANPENFSVANPVKDDDAIRYRLRARQVQDIRHMVPLRSLVMLTSNGVWVVRGADGYVTPTNVEVQPQNEVGASYVKPLVIGNTILYVQSQGQTVRSLNYTYQDDGYEATNVSILSRHLFRFRKVKTWAYAQEPDSIIWVIMDDGALLSFTFLREHDIYAWTKHETDGEFEDVSVIREGDNDAVYFTVKRTINGQTKRYIERLHSREFASSEDCFFVDCGLSYSGPAISTLSGLHHLEGKDVVALADGFVIREMTVSGGTVTLPMAASKIQIGLPYIADMETLAIELDSRQPTHGKVKNIPEVIVRVHESRGFFIGPDNSNLYEWKQREGENYDTPIALYTGDVSVLLTPTWLNQGKMLLRQIDPLPITVLAFIPEVRVGG